MVIRFSKMNAT